MSTLQEYIEDKLSDIDLSAYVEEGIPTWGDYFVVDGETKPSKVRLVFFIERWVRGDYDTSFFIDKLEVYFKFSNLNIVQIVDRFKKLRNNYFAEMESMGYGRELKE